jgi:hypothetical protein
MKLPFRKDGTAASANLDDVRRAFYNEYLPANPDYFWWWIQAVYTDPNEIVVEDDETGRLFRIKFSSDTDGVVTFGDAEPVRIQYVPDTRDANKAAATHVAATLAIGRKVLASWPTREDSVLPTTASGGAMDPKQIRERLDLPEDASDEQVKEQIRTLNEAAGLKLEESPEGAATTPTTPTPGTPVVTPPVPGTAPEAVVKTPEQLEQERIAASMKPPEGFVMIDSATLETLKTGASVALEQRTETQKHRRESLVAASIAEGRIAPAAKDQWLAALENSDKIGDTATAAALEAMPKGLIPVELRGAAPTTAEGDVHAGLDLETVNGWTDRLFPDVAARRAREKARAAGEPVSHDRVSADAAYARR